MNATHADVRLLLARANKAGDKRTAVNARFALETPKNSAFWFECNKALASGK